MNDLSSHRRELSYCATCPKLCRFSCPVSNAEPRETITPWGKMTAAYQHLTGSRPLDAASANATYACTGCMRCRTHCRHGNEVGLALFSARAEAVRSQVAPPAAAAIKTRFRQEAPLGSNLAEAREDFGMPVRAQHGSVVYFPGCSALTSGSDSIPDALKAARSLGTWLRLDAASDLCCGYPLLAAGHEAEFLEAADRFLASMKRLPALVVGDPGCAWTLTVAYPRFGRSVPFEVKLWVDEIAGRLDAAPERAPFQLASAYHDACYLGRGLGRYDSPRSILRRVVGPFSEAFESRDDAGCSGGGGLLPKTMPETSQAMAAALGRELGAPKNVLVTACPTAARMFKRAGAQAIDIATLVAKWLRGESPSPV